MITNKTLVETLKSLNKHAVMDVNSGSYQKAIETFKSAKLLEEKLGLTLQVGESLMNIANTYYLMREYVKSLEKMKSALDIFKSEKYKQGIFNVYQLMGAIYFQTNDYVKASQVFEKCIRLNLGARKQAKSLFQAAVVYSKINNSPRAQEYVKRALAEFEKLSDTEGIMDCLKFRASLFQTLGRKDLSAKDLRRSAVLKPTHLA